MVSENGGGMSFEEWSTLKQAMAIESFKIDAVDMMIPGREAEITARRIMAASDANKDGPQVQEWRRLERQMGNALIALEDLGYRLVRVREAPSPVEPPPPHTRFRERDGLLRLELSFDDGKTWRQATDEEADELIEIEPPATQ